MDPVDLLNYILLEHESEFVEFKDSNFNPDNTGELISALANGAVLHKKDSAYLVFGVNDKKKIVGTKFDPETAKKGNDSFKNWIASNLDNCNSLDYITVNHTDGDVVIIIIPRARMYPVKFKGVEHIRIGDSKKKLSEHPEIARKLWEEILRVTFEDGYASELLEGSELFERLDFAPYFELRGLAIPTQKPTIIQHMINDGVIVKKLGKYFITNMGATLFAKDFEYFDTMINRGVRLIKYAGTDKTRVERSMDGRRGYALGISELIDYVMLLLPSEEYLEGQTRKTREVFPREVIRELATNMIMHQDFAVQGYAPRIEIYDDRIEFSNPGTPVIEIQRFLDSNRSRNPKLAKLLRFMKLSEERGMGFDIVEYECELNYLPSPVINNTDSTTRVTVFDHKTLRQFNSSERINLVYMHCSLQHIKHLPTTNETLRSRFANGVLSPTVSSRWINEAVEKGFVRPFDPSSKSRRHASYVPFWA